MDYNTILEAVKKSKDKALRLKALQKSDPWKPTHELTIYYPLLKEIVTLQLVETDSNGSGVGFTKKEWKKVTVCPNWEFDIERGWLHLDDPIRYEYTIRKLSDPVSLY